MPNAAAAKTRGSRSERLEARVTPQQKGLIEQAAALQGRSVTVCRPEPSVQDAAQQAIVRASPVRSLGQGQPRLA